MKKALSAFLIVTMLICTNLVFVSAASTDVCLDFESDKDWMQWNTTSGATVSDTWSEAGGLGAKKISVAKGPIKDNPNVYFTYDFRDDFVRDAESQIFTLETKVKLTSCYHSLRLLGNGVNGSKWFAQLAFNADGTVSDSNTGEKLSVFDSDDSDTPDFSSGWHTLWFEINESATTFRLYMDHENQYWDLAFKDQWGGKPVSFTAVSWLLGTRTDVDNTVYMDYMHIYNGAAQFPKPDDKPDPPELSELELDFTDSLVDENGMVSWGGSAPAHDMQKGYAKIEALSTVSDVQTTLNIASLRLKNAFVAEMRVKAPSARSRSITLRMNDTAVNSGKAVTLSAQAENSTELPHWIDETNNKKPLGRMYTDISPVNPDFEVGWNTFYICADPERGTYKVYMDSQEIVSEGTFSISEGNYPTALVFTCGRLQACDLVSELYIDYIRIYSDEKKLIPETAEKKQNRISSDFEGLNIGDSVRRGLFGNMTPQAETFSAEVIADPVNPANKCLELKNEAASGDGYAYIVTPYKKAVVSFDVYIPEQPTGNQVQFRNTSAAFLTATFLPEGGLRIDQNNSSVLFNKGVWNKVKWVVDCNAGIVECFVNQNAPISFKGECDLVNVRFGVFSARNMIIDNLDIYEVDSTPVISASITSGTVKYGDKIYLEADMENTVIYYTLDGSEPDEQSLIYKDGIEITNHNTIIKARGVCANVRGWTYTFGKYVFEAVDGIVFAKAEFKKNKAVLASADTIAAGDEIEVDFTVVNTENAARGITLLVGVFDRDVMYAAQEKSISCAADAVCTNAVSLIVPPNGELHDWSVKAFVWENTQSGRTLGFRKTAEKQ